MKKKTKITFYIIITIVFSILSIFLYFKLTDKASFETFKALFTPGIKGYSLYFIFVVLQILFLPISTMFLIVPALIMFGAWATFYVTLLALCVGAVITYFVGLWCSKPINKWINKNEIFSKWNEQLTKNGKIFLPYFSIIPIFPDEIICLLAGISKINFWYFLCITILSRGIHLVFICFLGAVIPMYGWWLVLWITILLAITIGCYVLTKKQDAIKLWFFHIVNKK